MEPPSLTVALFFFSAYNDNMRNTDRVRDFDGSAVLKYLSKAQKQLADCNVFVAETPFAIKVSFHFYYQRVSFSKC